MPRLTDQQRVFASEYVRSGLDRQQACKVANYSMRNWASIACKLLKKSQIKAEIDRLIGQIEEKCTVEAGEIIREVRKVAFAPVSARVSNTDRLRALELLGKYLAMWSEKIVPEDPEKEAARKRYLNAEQAEFDRIVANIRTEELAVEPEPRPRVIPFKRAEEPKAG